MWKALAGRHVKVRPPQPTNIASFRSYRSARALRKAATSRAETALWGSLFQSLTVRGKKAWKRYSLEHVKKVSCWSWLVSWRLARLTASLRSGQVTLMASFLILYSRQSRIFCLRCFRLSHCRSDSMLLTLLMFLCLFATKRAALFWMASIWFCWWGSHTDAAYSSDPIG